MLDEIAEPRRGGFHLEEVVAKLQREFMAAVSFRDEEREIDLGRMRVMIAQLRLQSAHGGRSRGRAAHDEH